MVNDFSMVIVNQTFDEHCQVALEYALRFDKEVSEKIKLLSDLERIRLRQ